MNRGNVNLLPFTGNISYRVQLIVNNCNGLDNRGLHGNGDGGNPAESAENRQEWV